MPATSTAPEAIFVRLPDAERIIGLRRTKILELTYAGELPSVLVGRARLFPVAGLHAWAERQLAAAGQARRD